uniref:ribonucleoside-diphosphate reductase n=1 Tax=viral metagenome TaxID=1070528 RepID=A0A6C0H0N8_9ZZZZ
MNNKINMFVTKRDNSREEISFDKITSRIKFLSKDLDRLKVHNISLKTINSIYDGISTSELDNISANICATLASTDYQYNQLGGRILVSSAEKNIRILLNVKDNFCGRMNYIQKTYNKLYNRDYLIPEMVKYINENSEFLNNLIDYRRDYNFEFFGYKTLEKAYLVKFDDKPVESPQDLFLRVAVAIHYNTDNKDLIQKTYDYMSNGYFTHATPTLFNAGVINGQFASCFLVGTDDSIEGMYKNILDCAKISKGAGGIGIHISNVRAKNSIIKGSNGRSNGIIKLLKVLNETSRHVTQGGKRPGSFAIYLEPWHADVKDFLELKKAAGADSERCRDLFLALWIPDLFMKMVSEDGDWYLMSPDECPNLNETYGKEFEDLYNKYISEKKYREKVKAIDIWERILVSQIETGVPYITYKDKINERSNQKNIGIIKSSNLCSEVTEVSNIDTHSVCNLASIAVNKFYENNTYNWDKLKQVAKLATINLNKVIDINNYPTLESEKTNKSHRPIGVGIQGLADLFCQMKIPFDSQEAINIDGKIMECIYYGCIEGSVEMAQKEGPYDFYKNSDFDKNILQFDYDNNSKIIMDMEPHFDWNSLKEKIKEFGMRNSLLTALMPTASTSQILGNNECFEPYTSNIYTRSTQAGEFIMINKHLIQDLVELNLWDGEMRENIIINNGSVQDISNIPNRIKEIYKTVWEIKQKFIIDHSVVRGYFVDQSQSQNLFFPEPDTKKLHSAHLYSWRSGLKTGMYYLRTKPATSAIKFTIDANKIKADERRKEAEKKDKKYICNDEEGICLMCSA